MLLTPQKFKPKRIVSTLISFKPWFPSTSRLLPSIRSSTFLSECPLDDRARGNLVRRGEPQRREEYSVSSRTASSSSLTASNMTIQEFHQISDETLHQLTDLLERLIELDLSKVAGWDIDYSSGVMNFSMGEHGTYVLNKQPPNKQIWLSSPFSGPKRFDYDKDRQCWFYSRDGSQLIELMRDEISSILGDNSFSKLLQSS